MSKLGGLSGPYRDGPAPRENTSHLYRLRVVGYFGLVFRGLGGTGWCVGVGVEGGGGGAGFEHVSVRAGFESLGL